MHLLEVCLDLRVRGSDLAMEYLKYTTYQMVAENDPPAQELCSVVSNLATCFQFF